MADETLHGAEGNSVEMRLSQGHMINVCSEMSYLKEALCCPPGPASALRQLLH
jgi:hypothetical protein